MHIFSRIIYEDLKETFVCIYATARRKYPTNDFKFGMANNERIEILI